MVWRPSKRSYRFGRGGKRRRWSSKRGAGHGGLKRRFHGGITRSVVQKGIRGFADSQIVSMPYFDSFTMTGIAAGTVVVHNFSANNIFDPDVTGTGHQPLSHDQWGAIYNHYVVLGSRITVRVTSQGNTTADQGYIQILLADGTAALGSYQEPFENSRRRSKVLGMATSGQSTVSVRGSYSAKKFFKIANIGDNVTRLGAAMGASPTEQAYFRICAAPITTGATLGTISVNVRLDYIVMLSEPKTLPQS